MDFNLKKLLKPQKIAFIVLFAIIVFIASQFNFAALVGQNNQFFTYNQLIGPIAGGFLGPLFGFIAVTLTEVINFFWLGKELTLINIGRLFTLAFGTLYFGNFLTKQKNMLKDSSIFIPILAMIAFWLNPIGQQVWFYALFWTIPIITKIFFAKNLFARSLGATFTAHAVGGALWVWLVGMPAEAWIALIPITAFERLVFAVGISISFIVFNTVLIPFENKLPSNTIKLEKNYSIENFVKNITTMVKF